MLAQSLPVLDGEALVDGHNVRDAVARVQDHARGTAGGVERQDRLHLDVECGDVERLEEDLRGLLAVRVRVERRLRQQDRVLLGRDLKTVRGHKPADGTLMKH